MRLSYEAIESAWRKRALPSDERGGISALRTIASPQRGGEMSAERLTEGSLDDSFTQTKICAEMCAEALSPPEHSPPWRLCASRTVRGGEDDGFML